MFIRHLRLAALLIGSMAGHSILSAQNVESDNQELRAERGYSLASVNGEFALVGIYGANIARQLGLVHFKDGETSGFLRANIPGGTGTERTIVYLTFTGTTTIADDGTGVTTVSVTFPNGSMQQFTSTY